MAKTPNLRQKPSISAFFPCYNDAGSIGLLVKNLEGILKKITDNFEIIVVDDASRDESRNVLKDLKSEVKGLKLIFHKKNSGYGGALKSGLRLATGDLIFYTDGDGQYDPQEITKLLGKMTNDVDVVQGYKIRRSDPFYRLAMGRIYHYIAKTLFNLKIRDVDCDFRLIRKKAIRSISLNYNSGVICVELVKKLQDKGFKFVEVGVNHFPRLYGHSQYFNYKRIAKTMFELLELWWKLVILKKTNETTTGSSL